MKRIIIFFSLLTFLQEWSFSQEIFRGFNISSVAGTKVNLDTLSYTGAKLIRVSFGYSPLMDKNPPFGWNTAQFARLNQILDWAATNQLKVMIDPHTTPGTRDKYTIFPTDSFWTDPEFFPHLVRLWDTLALVTKDRGAEIYGLDLLNEPAIPCCDTEIWNRMVDTLTRHIRAKGNNHPIIIEPTAKIDAQGNYISRINNILHLKLPADDNLIVSAHMYAPNAFTHQGIGANPTGIHYPGIINGVYYDSAVISARLDSIRKFSNQHQGIRINIGEFSATRLAGTDGDIYVQDLVEIFEKEKWDWNYHEYRGSEHWDAEMPVGTLDRMSRDTSTPRMRMLRSYFAFGTDPLNIHIIQFSGQPQTDQYLIQWKLITDNPLQQVMLQKSKDGINYHVIFQYTPDRNQSMIVGNYSDPEINTPIQYYRLCAKNLSGGAFFSQLLKYENAMGKNIIIFPTVTADFVEIISDSKNVPTVYNTEGKMLILPIVRQIKGYRLDLSSLKPNIYFVQIDQSIFKLIKT